MFVRPSSHFDQTPSSLSIQNQNVNLEGNDQSNQHGNNMNFNSVIKDNTLGTGLHRRFGNDLTNQRATHRPHTLHIKIPKINNNNNNGNNNGNNNNESSFDYQPKKLLFQSAKPLKQQKYTMQIKNNKNKLSFTNTPQINEEEEGNITMNTKIQQQNQNQNKLKLNKNINKNQQKSKNQQSTKLNNKLKMESKCDLYCKPELCSIGTPWKPSINEEDIIDLDFAFEHFGSYRKFISSRPLQNIDLSLPDLNELFDLIPNQDNNVIIYDEIDNENDNDNDFYISDFDDDNDKFIQNIMINSNKINLLVNNHCDMPINDEMNELDNPFPQLFQLEADIIISESDNDDDDDDN